MHKFNGSTYDSKQIFFLFQTATPGYNQTAPQSQPYPQGQPTATYPAGGYPSNQPGYQQPPPIVVSILCTLFIVIYSVGRKLGISCKSY